MTRPSPASDREHGSLSGTLTRVRALLATYDMDIDAFVNAIEEALLREGAPRTAGLKSDVLGTEDPEMRAAAAAVAEGALQTAAAVNVARIVAASDSASEAAERLGLSPQALNRSIDAGAVLSVEVGGDRRIPMWQYSADFLPGLLPHLEQVLAAARERGLNAASLDRIMNLPQPALVLTAPVTPRLWLTAGGAPERVVRLLTGRRFL